MLGAPKYIERPQVKTIDTPIVRVLLPAEMKKRQAAVEQYELQLRQGTPRQAVACPCRQLLRWQLHPLDQCLLRSADGARVVLPPPCRPA